MTVARPGVPALPGPCPAHLGVRRFGGELVPPLALLVVEQHHALGGAHGEAGTAGGPGHAGHPRRPVLRAHTA